MTELSTYNVWNQLVRVVSEDMVAEYTYRPDGLRLTKTVDGVLTTHVWDGMFIALELNASRQVVNRFLRGLRLLRSDNHGWYVHNARGDVIGLTDNVGVMVRTYRYTAFGVELNQSAGDTNPFRFAGEYYDRETGTYYLRFRTFNPRLGRFTQPDPFWNIGNMMGSHAAIIQAGNLFMYCMHNPVRFVDPWGLWTKDLHEELTRLAMELLGTEAGLEELFAAFADFIVAGNRGVDYSPYRALRFWSESAQSRHFNRNSANQTDSRVIWGDFYLYAAIDMWQLAIKLSADNWFTPQDKHNMQMQALHLLGRGLHSVQDIEAHGDIGMGVRGAFFAVHLDPGTDCRHFDWTNDSKRFVTRSTAQVRFNTSLNDSVNFLSRFFTAVGFLN